jgi:hypothetical protein
MFDPDANAAKFGGWMDARASLEPRRPDDGRLPFWAAGIIAVLFFYGLYALVFFGAAGIYHLLF